MLHLSRLAAVTFAAVCLPALSLWLPSVFK
jgi:hypothetical protein